MDITAERLKRLREARTGNQAGVAKAAGMSQTTYSDWEANPPRALEYLAGLANHFHVSADYLLGLTNDPRSADERGAGWDETVVDIANMVMTLEPHRRVNVQALIGAVVERDKAARDAARRAEDAAQLAGLYEEALQSAAVFIAAQPLVGVEELTTLRDKVDALLGTHGARVIKALTKQSDG